MATPVVEMFRYRWKRRFIDWKMFRNCFGLTLIGWVVLIVLTDRGQRVTSDQNYGVFKKPSYLEHPTPIYERPLAPEKSPQKPKHTVANANPPGDKREELVARNSRERNTDKGRNIGFVGTTEADPSTKSSTETLASAARLFGSTGGKRPGTFFARQRRQMIEYYVDSPNGVIETRPSREGQYHVALGEKSSEQVVTEERGVRGASDKEETGTKLDDFRPRVVNDDSGEAEDVFFSEAKQGQNREALDLFRARSKRSSETDAKLAGQNIRHHDVTSLINDDKGPEGAKWLRVEYKAPGRTQQNADQGDFPYRRKNLSYLRNSSGKNANTEALRQIVKSILENARVARFIQKASTRSERRRRQILEYFVDSLVGKIDKRDTNSLQASTKDRSGNRRASQKASAQKRTEELQRSAYENDQMKQRELDRRKAAEETGRSVENDSDDLEHVLQKRAQRDEENAAGHDSSKQQLGADDANSKIRRHNDVISDAAEADDARDLDRRRAPYEDPEPSDDDVQEEDFYYVEDQSNLVKRESGQTNEKLDYEFDDNNAVKSKRAVQLSEEERKLLSKELVEIMITEINDRLQGKPGHPELQVRRRPLSTAAKKQEEEDKTEDREVHKRLDSGVSADEESKLVASKTRNKRHGDPIDEAKRRSAGLRDDFDELKRRRSILGNDETGFRLGTSSSDIEKRLEQIKSSTADKDAEEKAEDLDMTKQIVAIVIEHAVKHLRNIASSGTTATSLQKSILGLDSEQKSNNQGAEQGPPLGVEVKNQLGQETTPPAYWVVEPIPKGMTRTLINTSDVYFAGGYRYRRVTFPPKDERSKSAHYGSQAKRRRRRRRRSFIENGKSVQANGADFSSSAAKTRTGQRVFDGVESAIFCRVIRHLVDLGKISRGSYEKLLSTNVCVNVSAPYRNRMRRSPFRTPTPTPCQTTEDGVKCNGLEVPVSDPLTGGIADPRCGGLAYMRLYPSVYNFYRGQVTSRIPLEAIHSYGGYIWGGIGTGIQPPTEPPKRNSVWGVLFSFRLPFRLWGLRFIESPPTLDSVLSVVVYLQYFDDTKNQWTPVTEAGSKEPQVIPVTSPLIRFPEIHVVTGILIFPQEWRRKPILPHPVFISCTESDLENDPFQPPIFRISSWNSILEAIARDSKTYAMFDAMIPSIV